MTARRAPLLLAPLVALAAWAAPAAANTPSDLFYERSLMSAAGARCHLFDTGVAAALLASSRQAKGAALRAGVDPDVLSAAESRARNRAAGVPCASPDLATAAARVRKGFEGYSQIKTMTFPGDSAAWRADRGGEKRFPSDWRLSQSAKAAAGPVVFGVAAAPGETEALTAVAGWPGALAASGARLVMRDRSKASRPYLDPRRTDLPNRAPPRSVTLSFLASAREPTAPSLLPTGAYSGATFRFSPAAAAAMEELDPREAVVLELVYPARGGGERVETIPIEVGDFAAGRAFLSARR
ncbi:MAG TPA: hypothetical protein VL460_09235 [Caulobacteraceae bacterium]|jgi:hypothetical protein|nr:hypothetical protein [Caulobacteraceae bacterium]